MLFENEAPFTFEFLARPITHIKFHQSFENTTVELKVSSSESLYCPIYSRFYSYTNWELYWFILLKVCSDYDSKEEIFRNFGCILNSYTRLAVLHSWTSYSPKNFSITFVWIDSEGILAGSFDVKVSLKSSTSSEKFLHSPNFKHPLKPGAWRLLLFYQWKLIVEEKFLIHPVIFKAGVKLKESEISSLLGGPPDGIYSDHNFTAVEMRLKKNILSSYFKSEEESFSKIKTQNELLNWSLNLISKFWSVNDFCSLSKGVPCNYLDLKPCNSTLWSCHHADSSNLFLWYFFNFHFYTFCKDLTCANLYCQKISNTQLTNGALHRNFRDSYLLTNNLPLDTPKLVDCWSHLGKVYWQRKA